MTRQDEKVILRLAEKAGFANGHQGFDGRSLFSELCSFAELIRAYDRESAAKKTLPEQAAQVQP